MTRVLARKTAKKVRELTKEEIQRVGGAGHVQFKYCQSGDNIPALDGTDWIEDDASIGG